MITNNSPLWIRAMREMEEDVGPVVSSHITSEFLEATCTVPSFGYCADCGRVDPFCEHQTRQSSPQAKKSLNGSSGSPIAASQPWGTPIASPQPCPTCGERPWWFWQDERMSAEQDEEETLDGMYGF